MRVFLTGGTGHVGRAVAEAFLAAGHEVTALVRSPAKSAEAAGFGATPWVGDLRDPDSYRDAAAQHTLLVHTAFEYDDAGREVRSTDRAAAATLLDAAAAEGSAVRQVIYTSSAYLLGGLGREAVDEGVDTRVASSPSQWRLEVEREVLARAEAGGVRGAVVRAGLVYGGRGGTMPELFSDPDGHRAVHYYGDGQNRWTLVYLRDLAALYLAVAERRASGVFHGVDGAPLPAARVAAAASQAAGWGGRTRSIPLAGVAAEQGEHVDRALARDVAVVSVRSRELGWSPTLASFEDGAARAYAEWRAGASGG